jgi:hypothetical protein
MHQSEDTEPLQLHFVDRFVVFNNHHPMMTPFYQLTIRVADEHKQAIKSMMQTQVPGCTVNVEADYC